MAKTLTGHFGSADTARNALDDLINAGFARETMFLGNDDTALKVITPNDIEHEVREILGRHGPKEVTKREV
ncbi:hypothetical protein M1105_02545 [Limibaculum sp. FT325]|uniref:hypothetical protein n=1 Tax=Thermohalobaculum sediminis TaxID=2939436 RepID=UPI0020BFAFBE|nr:hypothetical protein [Limibaculum sediminis]MCL5775879.1 hypothetical protein [Limibaculum sediminis]